MTEAVEIRDGDVLVAKVYLSPNRRKLRVVLPELSSFVQVKMFPDDQVRRLEFTRSEKEARAKVALHFRKFR